MNNPDLFRRTNMASRLARSKFLKEFQPIMKWRSDGKDSLLDIGCAGGDITTDDIQKIMPKTFSRLVGVDICSNMVEYANKTYGNSKVSFATLDIGGDITEYLAKNEPFDHVTSLNCMHLVPDQKQAMENISKLLKPNGDCLLYTVMESPNFPSYKKMFKNWTEYMEDADDFISYFHNRVNPVYMLKKLLKNAGFSECIVESRESTFTYNNGKEIEDASRSIIPFYSRIPEEKRDEFIHELLRHVMEFQTVEDGKISVPFKHIIAYGCK